MKNIARIIICVTLLVCALTQAPASADSAAEFFVRNATGSYLRIFVDGSVAGAVPPGDQTTILVSVGEHSFRAEATDGRYVEHAGYVGPDGRTWTITE